MRLRALALVASAVLLVATVAGGCNFIVGVGDYAVGDASLADGSSGGEGGGGSSSGTSSSGGTSDGPLGQDTGTDGPAGEAGPRDGSVGAGSLGESCLTNADCKQGTCNGDYCTEVCAINANCGNNATVDSGVKNFCVKPGMDSNCAPSCKSTADCALLGRGTSVCQQVGPVFVCVVPAAVPDGGGDGGGGGSALIGDPCTKNSDCASNFCPQAWCSDTCPSAASTVCGSNSNGVTNDCVSIGSGMFNCFPGCSTSSDCTVYPGTTCQTTATAGTLVCSFTNGVDGDPCSTATTSPWTSCTSPAACNNGVWCSETCTGDSTCGSNSAGQAGYCVPSGGSSICFPGCVAYGDCATYPGTFCTPIYGSTRGLVCAASGHAIGDPCSVDADCKQGTCALTGGSWCSDTCTAGGTTCGSNSEGVANQCVTDSVTSTNICFAGCTTDTDCIPYGGATCKTVTGLSSMVCSF